LCSFKIGLSIVINKIRNSNFEIPNKLEYQNSNDLKRSAEILILRHLIVLVIIKFEAIICFEFRFSIFVFLSTIVFSDHFIHDLPLVGNHAALDDFILKVQIKALFFSIPEFLDQVVQIG
jgi:hypothetical protein